MNALLNHGCWRALVLWAPDSLGTSDMGIILHYIQSYFPVLYSCLWNPNSSRWNSNVASINSACCWLQFPTFLGEIPTFARQIPTFLGEIRIFCVLPLLFPHFSTPAPPRPQPSSWPSRPRAARRWRPRCGAASRLPPEGNGEIAFHLFEMVIWGWSILSFARMMSISMTIYDIIYHMNINMYEAFHSHGGTQIAGWCWMGLFHGTS